MRTFIIASAVLAATVAIVPATAGGPTRTVRYADLDLSTARGAAKLDRRIAGAVEEVCGSYASAARDEENMITGCRRAAMQSYKTQLAAITSPARLAAR